MNIVKAIEVTVQGRVQGVGFRPYIFGLAKKFMISGTVQNNMDGVKIFAEGQRENVDLFLKELKEQPPRLSRIDYLFFNEVDVVNVKDFTIVNSERQGKSSLVIPIDAAICDDCLNEMKDPNNFRHQYPFINCTQCGPRYTIITGLPYDRPFTTMESFKMCEDCLQEYENPENRRHHAQPIACPKCGPKVSLLKSNGTFLAEANHAIEKTRKLLKSGSIVAIKGIGGYHLACNALDKEAIERLRARKNRKARPLAVMVRSLAVAERFAVLSNEEKQLLCSCEAPIVVVKKQQKDLLLEEIAPNMNTVGLLLPYTGLHHLLFNDDNELQMIVMTSANPSGLPMLYKDADATSYLNEIADYILSSDRLIAHPLDDSVVQVINGEVSLFRRARGYAPDPFFTDNDVNNIIALGSQQKNTFAIGRNEQIFVGPHIGDLGSIEVSEHYLNELHHLLKWLDVTPSVVAIDKHPSYETNSFINHFEGAQVVKVQHHHAHLVSCMEDNRITDPCLGLILDGTGYGEDGHIWGFELLYGDAKRYERLGHLTYYPLPGGEKAVFEPWRNAVSLLVSSLGEEEGLKKANLLFPDRKKEINLISLMISKNINSPLAGTCGRLFDAVSAILGICEIASYDGEAAIALSELVDEKDEMKDYYPFLISNKNNLFEINFEQLIVHLINDVFDQINKNVIAKKFHQTIVEMCVKLVSKQLKNSTLAHKNIVLSGGSFHNRFLHVQLKKRLKELGLNVYTHSRVPCNDGGLSLGQLMIAKHYIRGEK